MNRKTKRKANKHVPFYQELWKIVEPEIENCKFSRDMIPKKSEDKVDQVNQWWNRYAAKNKLEYNKIREDFISAANEHLLNKYYDRVIDICFKKHEILLHDVDKQKDLIIRCYQDYIKASVCAQQIKLKHYELN